MYFAGENQPAGLRGEPSFANSRNKKEHLGERFFADAWFGREWVLDS